EEKNNTLISVMAEIARNYMELRGFQKKSEIIETNIELLEKKAELVQNQWKSGYVNKLKDENILAILANERAKFPDIKAQIYQNIFALSILIGEPPETLLEELLPEKPMPKPPESIHVGIKSNLLRRRPDVRRAERDLAAATADIGVAVASFFPTFTIIGNAGLQSLALKKLFSMGSKTWAIGGGFGMPIFQGGNLVGNLRSKYAATESAAKQYQQTVLTALEETESSLMKYTQDLLVLSEKQISFDRYQNLTTLSKKRHTKGLSNLLSFIDAELILNEADFSLVESEIATLFDLIFLYKSLGGGWEEALECVEQPKLYELIKNGP
ncbi:MAG: TolC family protein, partial [Simkaniaceae bacterium]|nr:TolC family protein [Simkaniaceae bacterium]